jgi:hypothetical protein
MSSIIRGQFHRRTGEFGNKTWQKWFVDYLQMSMNGWKEDEYLALLEALGISEDIWRMRHELHLPIKTICEQTGLKRRMVFYHLARARKFREAFWSSTLQPA